MLWRGLSQSVEHELRVETYANVQQLDVSWHEGSAPGRVLSVISDDINQLERFLDVGARVILHTVLDGRSSSARCSRPRPGS